MIFGDIYCFPVFSFIFFKGPITFQMLSLATTLYWFFDRFLYGPIRFYLLYFFLKSYSVNTFFRLRNCLIGMSDVILIGMNKKR